MPRRRKIKQEPLITLAILLAISIAAVISSFPTVNSSSLIVLLITLGGLLAIAIIIAVYLSEARKLKALRAVGEDGIDVMSGEDFEKYVGALLKSRGYRVKYTKRSGDFGVDIIAKKRGVSTSVQCKRAKSTIGERAIQEAVAGTKHYKCNKSMVVTNSTFTTHAKALAKSNQCELIDRVKLGEWRTLLQANPKSCY